MHDNFLASHDRLARGLELELGHFFDLTTDLLCIISCDGLLLRVNAAWRQTVGFISSEAEPLAWLEITHAADRPQVQQALERLTQPQHIQSQYAVNGQHAELLPNETLDTVVELTCRCCCSDGSYKALRWTLTRPDGTTYIYAVVHDATSQLAPYQGIADDRFRRLVDNITDYAIYMLDPDGCVISWNQGAKAIHGYDAVEILGQSITLLYMPDDVWQGKHTQDLELATSTGRFEGEGYRFSQTRASFWAHVVMTAVYDDDGVLVGFAVVTRDVTDRRQTEEQLLYTAFHDALTGLPNVALFKERLNHAFQRSQRQDDYQFAVLFLDVDRFKVINDSLGHRVGDDLLVAIAHRLKLCLRSLDMVARLGGDEFAILLENVSTVQNVTDVADRIRREVVLPFMLNGHEIFTNVSIGIALSSLGRPQAEDLLTDADTAMYRAKALGRGRYEIFDEVMHTQTARVMQIEHDLRWVIERQELSVHYQPIISLRANRIEGFEALLRWQHPVWGMISPAEFIPVAEETGLIVPIGYWVLEEACRQVKLWQQQFPDYAPLTVNVNLSARQFTQPDLLDKITAILNRTEFDTHSLKLEITESVILGNAEQVSTILSQLKGMGIRLALDDFGTGYSSLSYLHRYPVDTLKIDRSFIDQVDTDGEKLELVRTIITLAWNLGMAVVAEGVETNKQVAQLRALQCESVQGYYFSKPLAPDAMPTWLAALPPSEQR